MVKTYEQYLVARSYIPTPPMSREEYYTEVLEYLCIDGTDHDYTFVSFEGCIDCTVAEKCSKCGNIREIEC